VIRGKIRVGDESKGRDYAVVDLFDNGFFFFFEPGFFPEDGGFDLLPLLPVEALAVALSAPSAFRADGFDFFLFEALGDEPLRAFFDGFDLDWVLLLSSARRVLSSRCNLFVCFVTESCIRLSSCKRVAGGSMSISMAADSVALLSKCSVLNFFRAASTAFALLFLRYKPQAEMNTDSRVRLRFEAMVSSTALRIGGAITGAGTGAAIRWLNKESFSGCVIGGARAAARRAVSPALKGAGREAMPFSVQ
jgi:hypothetical protein